MSNLVALGAGARLLALIVAAVRALSGNPLCLPAEGGRQGVGKTYVIQPHERFETGVDKALAALSEREAHLQQGC